MRNKIKRIITSLALAASLVLAPMNVSAEASGTLQITQGDVVEGVANKQTTVRVNRGGIRYVVEVPEVLEFNLTNEGHVPAIGSDAEVHAAYSTEELPMYLRRAYGLVRGGERSVAGGGGGTEKYNQYLKITPSFKADVNLGIVDDDVSITGGDVDTGKAFKLEPPYQEQQPFDYSKSATCTLKDDAAKDKVYDLIDENDPNGAITIGHIQYRIEVSDEVVS